MPEKISRAIKNMTLIIAGYVTYGWRKNAEIKHANFAQRGLISLVR